VPSGSAERGFRTADEIGADIGFGIILLLGAPVVAAFIMIAVVRERDLRRTAAAGGQPTPLLPTIAAGLVGAACGRPRSSNSRTEATAASRSR
jgi:hypothetical protein